MKQVVVIHGGNTFETYEQYLSFLKSSEFDFERLKTKRFKDVLGDRLGKDFEVILPSMPNSENAKYEEWKIWFEKIVPFLEETIILVGHSLGGIFLAKYLSEEIFPKKILGTFLIAAPYDGRYLEEFLGDFALPKSLERFMAQGGKINLYHSKDDPVVPFVNVEKYKEDLPEAEVIVFEDREHFSQDEFLELTEDIKKLY